MADAGPEWLRLYREAVDALPLPGERMTVAEYEDIRDLLWEDAKAREPQDGESADSDRTVHFNVPPGLHVWVLGDRLEIVSVDHHGDGIATLHAKRRP